MIGSRLGPYRILDRLGSGGMGEVYRALDERLHREVAIKVLTGALPGDGAATERLHREAIALSQIRHPNIATVYDVGTEGDRFYVVLELLPGGTLATSLLQGPLSLDRALELGIQIARGLEAAHASGIVHRDLKPGNIALDSEGRAKILDFGTAGFLADRHSIPTGVAPTLGVGGEGTLPYMAPEQLRHEPCTERTDLYALGAVLHELLTGRRAFPGANESATIEAILHRAPQPIRENRPSLPAGLEALVCRLLAKTPDDRPESATKVVDALEEIVADPGSRPLSAAAPRRALRGWIAAGVVALLVTGWQLRPEPGVVPDSQAVVVFPLEILGEDEPYLGRAFADAVTVNLAQSAGLEVLPVPSDPLSGRERMVRSAQKLGATQAVLGSLVRERDSLTMQVVVIDTRSNRVLWGDRDRIDPADVGASATALAHRIGDRLGAATPRMYEYFRYESGTPEMAKWPGLPGTIAALRRHDVEEGLARTESLLVLFPLVPEAHVMRIVALVDQDNMHNATVHSRRALRAGLDALERVEPNNPNVIIHRPFEATNVEDLAEEHRARAARLSAMLEREDLRPGLRSQALRYRAVSRRALGRADDAEQDLEQARLLDPANPYNYAFLSGHWAAKGNHAEALKRMREAAAIDRQFALGLPELLLAAGQREEALRHSEALCRTSPSANMWAFHAAVLVHCGRHDEARTALQRARTLPPTGNSELLSAQTWCRLNDRTEALASLERAIELGYRSSALGRDTSFVALRRDPEFLRLASLAHPEVAARP